jgi:ankyrin repeat protein
MRAAGNGRTATAAELVRLGADINGKDNVRACEGIEFESTPPRALRVLQLGWTALIWAAYNGHIDTVTELVRLGADINAVDNVRMHAPRWAGDAAWLAVISSTKRLGLAAVCSCCGWAVARLLACVDGAWCAGCIDASRWRWRHFLC